MLEDVKEEREEREGRGADVESTESRHCKAVVRSDDVGGCEAVEVAAEWEGDVAAFDLPLLLLSVLDLEGEEDEWRVASDDDRRVARLPVAG